MTRPCINIILALCLTPLLLNCATTQDVQSTNVRVSNINEKIEEIKTSTVKREASSSDRLEQLQIEIMRLDGQLEENAHYHRTMREENKEMRTSLVSHIDSVSKDIIEKINTLNNRIAQLNEKIIGLDARIVTTQSEIDKIKQASAAEAAERAREAAERAREAAEALAKARAESARAESGSLELVPDKIKKVIDANDRKVVDVNDQKAGGSTKTDLDDKGKELYDKALSLYKADKFKEAYNTFLSYINKYPKGSMAANTRFWMGDCLYQQKDFEFAILEYQKVISDFPGHDKVPAALLKQGLAFENLNDPKPAIIIYEKLLSEYPESSQVSTARKHLESLQK